MLNWRRGKHLGKIRVQAICHDFKLEVNHIFFGPLNLKTNNFRCDTIIFCATLGTGPLEQRV